MSAVRLVHTADLSPAHAAAAQALLRAAFDDLDDTDWEHALGGLHALALDGDGLVGHAALVQRRLLHGGRALRCGYLEAVAVRADRRRQGVGSALMAALEPVVRAAYDLGALGTSDEGRPLYVGRGWLPWRGPTAALTRTGVVRTPGDDGGVLVLPSSAPLDLEGELVADLRDGDAW